MKLTKAQLEALCRLSRGAEYHVSHKPQIRALARLSLVETNEFNCTVITDAGRRAATNGETKP